MPEAAEFRRRDAAMLPLVVKDLRYAVSGKPLLGPINLHLENDGITAVMGPNGAGKSILLRLLHGLIRRSGGELRWAGRPLDDSIRRRQAMVFQKPVLLRRSVAANIDFALRLRAVPDITRQREHLLRLAGLDAAAKRPARVLSGGEQQRLAIVRALALEPDVLFLDEPTASLDPAATLEIEELAAAVRDTGVKIIMITHDAGQARRLADDVIFLNRGRVTEHTPAARFFERPASPEAAAYLAGKIVL